MGFSATVVDPLSMPVPAAWNDFVEHERLLPMWRSELIAAAGWCETGRASMVLVGRDGESAPVALFHAQHPGLRPGRFAKTGTTPGTIAVCRLAASTNSAGAAFAAGLSLPDRIAATQTFERALGRGRPIAYREVSADDLPALGGRHRLRRPLAPRMTLANGWTDLDRYLRTLNPKWRSQLKKIRRTVADLRCAVEPRVDADDAAWLLETVRLRHAGRWPRPPLPARYLGLLMDRPDISVLTYRDDDGRLVGYSLVHDDGERLLLIVWGARGDTDGGRRDLYFDQYVRLVDRMIRDGRRTLVLGKGMTDIKARYGAVPTPLWGLAGWR